MNASGTFNVLRLLVNPALCLPHHTVATFDQLPIPLSKAFSHKDGEKEPDIRAVVLDKDNCIAIPNQNQIYEPYQAKFEQLRHTYPGSQLLIVSNSAGTGSDKDHAEADLIERNTGVKVLRHSTKKPGCHAEIMTYFRNAPGASVSQSSQVAIVGDRLFTDVMMANMMGSYGVWIKDGVVPDHGIVRVSLKLSMRRVTDALQLSRFEKGLANFLVRRGYAAPDPRSDSNEPQGNHGCNSLFGRSDGGRLLCAVLIADIKIRTSGHPSAKISR